MKMNGTEYILTSSQTSQQFSVGLWDYETLNVKKHYRNGGVVGSKCLEAIGEDYILAAEIGKPLLHVWPLNSQDVSKNLRLILPEPATCLAISPQNTYLAVGINSKLFIWQLASGKLLSVQQKHFQPITVIKFSSDGDFVVVGGQDGILVTYLLGDIVSVVTNLMEQSDIGQADPLYIKNDHTMPIRDIHVGQFGRKSRFATVSSDQTCRLYCLKSGENLLTLIFDEPLTSVIMTATFWHLFVGTDSGKLKQFNLINTLSQSQHVDDKTSLSFIGHKKKIVCLALNMSNSILASGSEDNFVFTWEIKSRQILKKIEHKSPITNIKFIPNYRNFVVENFSPVIILKSLQRSHDGNTDFSISIMQTEDLDIDEEDIFQNVLKDNEALVKENRRLRAINKQVYDAALSLREKYKT